MSFEETQNSFMVPQTVSIESSIPVQNTIGAKLHKINTKNSKMISRKLRDSRFDQEGNVIESDDENKFNTEIIKQYSASCFAKFP